VAAAVPALPSEIRNTFSAPGRASVQLDDGHHISGRHLSGLLVDDRKTASVVPYARTVFGLARVSIKLKKSSTTE
jgi:hypothetical protein